MPKKHYSLSKWDKRYITIAKLVSEWSKDPSKVGAVIVTNEGIALGYNGFPMGIEDDERLSNRAKKLNMIIHAEQNAICQAAKLGISIEDATLYTRMTPCRTCTMLIIICGIKKVVCERKYHAGGESEQMFKEAEVLLEYKFDDLQEY